MDTLIRFELSGPNEFFIQPSRPGYIAVCEKTWK